MGYSRRLGRRPMEQASKSSHQNVINDAEVQRFLRRCALPRSASDVTLNQHVLMDYKPVPVNPIRHIVAVDSGFTEVPVQKNFPSSTLCFFQFGALMFSVADLESLEESPFIDPEDMAKLKRIERLKLTLPIRNIAFKDQATLTASVRAVLYDFFAQVRDDTSMLETLRWVVFEEYLHPEDEYNLASCPECEGNNITVHRAEVTKEGRFSCGRCKASLYLTDVFRLHEVIDDTVGAGGILGYLTTLVEQFVMVHFLRLILEQRPALLKEILFIKDGPLAFFGQTANMYKKMRALVRYLFDQHNLYMAGLEKSGAFVEHAAEIATVMKDGSILILDNDYIYKYIIPGKADPANAYGQTTYYSAKLIFKSRHSGVHVVTVPTVEPLAKPKAKDLRNLNAILTNIEKLRCDMYDDALIPIALVNKLVSLANHPSSKILQRFAIETVGH
jgi:hypothetical protein